MSVNTPRIHGGFGQMLDALGWTLTAVGWLMIFLRLYGASQRAGEIRWDFIWILCAGIVGLVSQALFSVSTVHGAGAHVTSLPFPEIGVALKYTYLSIFVGVYAVIFAKWAIIALLLQVRGPHHYKRRMFLWSLGILTGLLGTLQLIMMLTQCVHIDQLWNVLEVRNCPRTAAVMKLAYAQGAFSVATDLMLAVYPISIVWNLQTSVRMKIGFCCLMAGGIIPATACILRTLAIRGLDVSPDATRQFALFMFWAAIELWLLIILGSIPPLRPLFKRLFQKIHHSGQTYQDSQVPSPVNSGKSNGSKEISTSGTDHDPWTGPEKGNARVMSREQGTSRLERGLSGIELKTFDSGRDSPTIVERDGDMGKIIVKKECLVEQYSSFDLRKMDV